MTIYELEFILGEKINRGCLVSGFPSGMSESFYDPDLIDPNASTVTKAPPLPDLGLYKLNPTRTVSLQKQTKEFWNNMTKEQREAQIKKLSANRKGKKPQLVVRG